MISWWAREDSNLQPSGYEHRNHLGKVSKIRHFRRRLLLSDHVWLRGFIGHLLVGRRDPVRAGAYTLPGTTPLGSEPTYLAISPGTVTHTR